MTDDRSDSVRLDAPGMVRDALHETVTVVEQRPLAKNTYWMRLHCPRIAAQIRPGQFFMIRFPGQTDPLLGRPFALLDTYTDEDGQPAGIDFGYVVVGKMTGQLVNRVAGDRLEMWGPLGNGFPTPSAEHLMFVAGGIGQTPFLAVAKEALGLKQYGRPHRVWEPAPQKVSMGYGVRSADYLAGVELFDLPGLDFQFATDDGSAGHHGLVGDLLLQALDSATPPDAVFCCGPEPMMRAIAGICEERHVECWLSLETPMACGFGACFSCVTRVRTEDDDWDYRRVCVEGPVFPASSLAFSE